MRLSNEFRIERPADDVFALLADVERVAPCLPGATLEGSEDSGWVGRMSVQIGPVKATYRGLVQQIELDQAARRSVMLANADEQQGGGDVEARITTWVEPDGEGSRVHVETDLQLRGRLAQFGRGALDKIAQRMLTVFATNLERAAAAPVAAEAERPADEEVAGARPPRETPAPAAPLDLAALGVGPPQWVPPALIGLLVGLGYGYLLGRLRELRS